MSEYFGIKRVEDNEENHNNIMKQIDVWIENFSNSKYFEPLTDAEKSDTCFAICEFAGLMYDYTDKFPNQWSKESMKEVLCELFPRKITAGQEFYENVEAILRAFFLFLGKNRYVKKKSELIAALVEYCPIMIKNSNNESNWGIAKQFMMAAESSGVDISNKNEMNRFMALYNLQNNKKMLNEKESIRTEPKVGRNDPCPCGSGKKYKKCCGR
jgi:uncharacterized protein YchJ